MLPTFLRIFEFVLDLILPLDAILLLSLSIQLQPCDKDQINHSMLGAFLDFQLKEVQFPKTVAEGSLSLLPKYIISYRDRKAVHAGQEVGAVRSDRGQEEREGQEGCLSLELPAEDKLSPILQVLHDGNFLKILSSKSPTQEALECVVRAFAKWSHFLASLNSTVNRKQCWLGEDHS